MSQQKNQGEDRGTLLDGIHSEVSVENQPLLNFITKYASVIAGCVLVLLLVLGGLAVWNWYHHGKQQEAREELARINMQLKGKDRETALSKLAANAPDNVKLFIYLSLGQSAQENGNPILAADAYAKAAEIDGDGPLGLTAALGSVTSLLMQGEFQQGLALLQELEAKLPPARHSVQFKQLLAEAAYGASKLELAEKIYTELGQQVNTPQASYFRERAEQIAAEIAKR